VKDRKYAAPIAVPMGIQPAHAPSQSASVRADGCVLGKRELGTAVDDDAARAAGGVRPPPKSI